MSRVLIDGWPLVYEPASPAALQIWALLDQHPSGIELILALPGERPTWLDSSIVSTNQNKENKPWKRLAWEQRTLPRMAEDNNASFLHTTSQTAPVFSRISCTNSPAYFSEQHSYSLPERLGMAAAQGGLSTVRAWLWPSDLPGTVPGQFSCAPFTHREFSTPRETENIFPPEIPEHFVLYHGPHDEVNLRRLISSWSWAAGPIGDYYPLCLLSPYPKTQDLAWTLIKEFQAEDTVQVLPEFPTYYIPALYRSCSVLFHPAEISPWGDPVMQALSCGKPIVAAATPWANARLGSAAYTAPLDDPRALGAALITLLVEGDMAEKLANAARQRSNTWGRQSVQSALSELWQG